MKNKTRTRYLSYSLYCTRERERAVPVAAHRPSLVIALDASWPPSLRLRGIKRTRREGKLYICTPARPCFHRKTCRPFIDSFFFLVAYETICRFLRQTCFVHNLFLPSFHVCFIQLKMSFAKCSTCDKRFISTDREDGSPYWSHHLV